MENEEEIENVNNKYEPSFLFFLLSKTRFKIVTLLKSSNYTLREVREKLNEQYDEDVKSNFALQLHLDLLIENKIIKKDYNNKRNQIVYNLTPFGLQIYGLTCSLQYIWKNKDYYHEHTIIDLPSRFSSSIAVLNNAQLITGHPAIMRKLIEMYTDSTFIYNVLYEVEGVKEIRDILKEKLQSNPNFHTKTIFGENSRLDPDRDRDIKEFEQFKRNGQIHQRIVKLIKIGLVANDKKAFICFPKFNENHPDTGIAIYDENEEFYRWCLNYFHDCWNRAEEFDIKRINTSKKY